MALKKSEKNMLVFLGVVVIGAVAFTVLDGAKQKAAEEEAAAAAAASTTQASGIPSEAGAVRPTPVLQRRAVKGKIFPSWKRDPFNANVTKVATVTQTAAKSKTVKVDAPVLQGILMNQNGAQAVIDNVILKEGETKKGIHVLSISSTEVKCTKSNRTFTLHWSKLR